MNPVHRLSRITKNDFQGEGFPSLCKRFGFEPRQLEQIRMVMPDREVTGLELWDVEWREHVEKAPPNAKAFALAQSIEHFTQLNAAPYLLEHKVAPLFFEYYPDGAIWFVRISQHTMRKFWARERDFAKSIQRAPPSHPFIFNVQPYSAGGPDVFPFLAIDWLATLFFPNFLFATAYVTEGAFLFFPTPPARLKSWGEDDHLRASIQARVDRIFGDDRGPARDQRMAIPASALTLPEVERLTEWWLGRVSRTWDRLLRRPNTEELFTIGLTLTRTFAESIVVNTSFNHLVRKTVLWQAIDKLSSLRHQGPGNREPETWKRLVSQTFLRREILPFVGRSVPGCVPVLQRLCKAISSQIEDDGLSPDLLRAYRNTTHGYHLRRDRDLLLSHQQPISNDLPDLLNFILLHGVGSRRQATLFRK